MNNGESSISNLLKSRVVLYILIMLVIVFLTPFGLMIQNHPTDEFSGYLIWITGTLYVGAPIPIGGGEMVPPTANPFSIVTQVISLILRVAVIGATYMYYGGKLSRGIILLAGIVNEILPFVLFLPDIFNSISLGLAPGQIFLPIPILLIFLTVILFISPRNEIASAFESIDT